jgi:hypothetical protein
MKKLLLFAVALILSVSSFAQTPAMNAYYGTSGKLGFEFTYLGTNKILYGMGFSTTLTTLGVGEDYTGIMRPDQFDEMFEVVSGEDVSVYGIVGYQVLDKLTMSTNFGYGTTTKYYNSYDRLKILSPTGYYYTSTPDGGVFVVGLNATYSLNDYLSVMVGYDNFNEGKIGLGLNF